MKKNAVILIAVNFLLPASLIRAGNLSAMIQNAKNT
jgi:hypothetical protein